jgi:tetratricopeptide (TPR) repeat protein
MTRTFSPCRYLPVVALLLLLLAGGTACRQKTADHPDLKVPAYTLPQTKDLTLKIARDTGNAKLYFNRGEALRKLQLDSFAIRDFEHAIRLDSTQGEYYGAIGDILFESHDISGSVEWLRKALRLNPQDPKARLKMAKMMLFTKDYKGAITEINTVLRGDAYTPEAYFLKGMVYKDTQDTAKAISSFQTALQVQPDFKDAHLQLGFIAAARNDVTALQYFRNAYTADTNDLFPIYARAQFLQARRQSEDAKIEYRFAIAQAPEYADAYFALGALYLTEDSVEKALPLFEKAHQFDPQNADAAYNLGLSQEVLGNKPAALKSYEAALKLRPTYAAAAAGKARVQ